MKNPNLKIAAAALGLIALSAPSAQAVLISGDIAFDGNAVLNGPLDTATAFTSFDNIVTGTGTQNGDYASVSDGFAVDMFGFGFDPAAGLPVNPLWSFTSGGDTYSFVLESITGVTRFSFPSLPPQSVLVVEGSGYAEITGFDSTPGAFIISLQGPSGAASVTFSSTTIAEGAQGVPVPEGGETAILLGGALLGLVLIRRRTDRSLLSQP